MSNTLKFITFVLCIIFMHLLFSIFAFILTTYTFTECYRSENHFYMLVILYWWCPFCFIMMDVEDK